ncbi:hypothetical protein L228DRAFT_245837 [Xylona heveae TC161]|uniref:Uncharacterized protein n=1 Tax=Xylona heveae (strain CBS 132557 / TC161) TaxID=1328760 RepID=A0A165H7W8_XYLHT|nr:hypothetical protein L228DRAFT_245837 [Xylona heveae TC161]KZF23109.1 hypothetical protein L228DRAFT_245837 [Xylona heveae TC161]
MAYSPHFNRRNLPIFAVVSMGALYLGLKSRSIMLKREKNRTEGDYRVDPQRSGGGV